MFYSFIYNYCDDFSLNSYKEMGVSRKVEIKPVITIEQLPLCFRCLLHERLSGTEASGDHIKNVCQSS